MAGKIIAFSGKGGAGKTTVTAMVLRRLIRDGQSPILAVDADPNATLAMTLGVEQGGTISDLRDRMGDAAQKVGEISKEHLMDLYLNELVNEQEGFDLLAMGRPEGRKCYCYVNALLRRYLSVLRKNYAFVLVDCEAGMEYLSRLVVDDVEAIVLVAEPTPVGLTTIKRISELAEALELNVGRRILALNKVMPDSRRIEREEVPAVEAVVRIPFDGDIIDSCTKGRGIDEATGPEASAAIEELTNRCLGREPVGKQGVMNKEPAG